MSVKRLKIPEKRWKHQCISDINVDYSECAYCYLCLMLTFGGKWEISFDAYVFRVFLPCSVAVFDDVFKDKKYFNIRVHLLYH